MFIAFILAFILIYAILATILNSFIQPFIILSIIPLGLVGVTYGFMIFQLPVGFMAIMGTIGLIGIIVNDSIVMVSFVNNYRYDWQRRHGLGLHSRASANRHVTSWVRWVSLMKSGYVRFRPILLTTVTTVVGMSTIAFTRTGQEQFIAPMALAIVCGLSLGSAVTLFVTPSVYAVLDDIIYFFFGKGDLPPDFSDKTAVND
jgi:multidrug efflux pump subunit AcrB